MVVAPADNPKTGGFQPYSLSRCPKHC